MGVVNSTEGVASASVGVVTRGGVASTSIGLASTSELGVTNRGRVATRRVVATRGGVSKPGEGGPDVLGVLSSPQAVDFVTLVPSEVLSSSVLSAVRLSSDRESKNTRLLKLGCECVEWISLNYGGRSELKVV